MNQDSLRKSDIFVGQASVSFLSRLSAKMIDSLMVLILYLIASAFSHTLGLLLSLALCAFQDGMGVGQSIGKRMMGLQVLEEPNGLACSFWASFIRNIPFMLLMLTCAISGIRFLAVVVAIPIVILETYLLVSLDTGVRLGDVLANTKVGEYLPQRSDSSL